MKWHCAQAKLDVLCRMVAELYCGLNLEGKFKVEFAHPSLN